MVLSYFMEHRLLEAGFTLVEINCMTPVEVVGRYSVLIYIDEKRTNSREEDTEEWSQLALTK